MSNGQQQMNNGQRVIYNSRRSQPRQNTGLSQGQDKDVDFEEPQVQVHPGGGVVSTSGNSQRQTPQHQARGSWIPSMSVSSCFSVANPFRSRSAPLTGNQAPKSEKLVISRPEKRQRTYNSRRRSNRPLYTMQDLISDTLRDALRNLNIQAPYLPNLLVEYLPLYHWIPSDDMNVPLKHCGTIASNEKGLFGVVLGSKLNPNVDHVISIRLTDGIEFGVGVASEENVKKDTKRDFMCEDGGWGYYNYKTKHQGTRPKYPSGWYSQKHECMRKQPESDIIYPEDVVTITIMREGLTGPNSRVHPADVYNGPRKGNGRFTIRYFKNGRVMGTKDNEFHNIPGPLQLCLNYYFMSSTLKILSDFKINTKIITEGLEKYRKTGKQ